MVSFERGRRRFGPVLLGVAVCLGALATGCQSTVSDRDLQFISTSEVESLGGRRGLLGLRGEESVAWIDPRLEHEFRAGHIPGALNIQIDEARGRLAELRDYDVIVVYGERYNSAVALAMSKALLGLGLSDVRTLRGGMEAWREEGMAVVEGGE
jgi:rhodanese-related sulfurtransferase